MTVRPAGRYSNDLPVEIEMSRETGGKTMRRTK
jgi:hypothetical protein